MESLNSLSVKFENGQTLILDQTLLPHEEKWIVSENIDHMVELIKGLHVRGAPAIGVAAGMALCQYALSGANFEEIEAAAAKLNKSRPTAVNLMMATDRLVFKADKKTWSKDWLVKEAFDLFKEDIRLCEQMADQGAKYIEEGDNILTHCNTGGLATVGIGTAFGVIRKAHEQGKKIHVYVDETRPLLQGGRLTAWECGKFGIPHTLICDNMAAMLMAQGKIQKVFVGSDRVARNGDFANKIGTYAVAVLAKHHNIPFYPVAPYTTIDSQCPNGAQIPIEQRDAFEVKGVRGHFGEIQWGPKESPVFNPAFDVTPTELITKFIFDHGSFSTSELIEGKHL
jgi:methylthioribose-1-phosphate isomerase